MALDDDDVLDPETEALNELLRELEAGASPNAVRAGVRTHWSGCTSASLLLALAERMAPRRDYLLALAACARDALPLRSAPAPELASAIDVVEKCARGEATPQDARDAAGRAYNAVSRLVAGVDDEVGMATVEACDLAAGDRFEPYGPDPAFRAAWALGQRDGRTAAHQARLADLVRRFIPPP
jgi:hypothetical protein